MDAGGVARNKDGANGAAAGKETTMFAIVVIAAFFSFAFLIACKAEDYAK